MESCNQNGFYILVPVTSVVSYNYSQSGCDFRPQWVLCAQTNLFWKRQFPLLIFQSFIVLVSVCACLPQFPGFWWQSCCFSVGFASANTQLWALSLRSSHDVAEMLQTYVVTCSSSVLVLQSMGQCGRRIMGREGSDISRYTETGWWLLAWLPRLGCFRSPKDIHV